MYKVTIQRTGLPTVVQYTREYLLDAVRAAEYWLDIKIPDMHVDRLMRYDFLQYDVTQGALQIRKL